MILIIFFLSSVSATQTYLNQSDQWEGNLTKIYMSALTWGDLDNDNDFDLITTGVCGIGCYSSKVYINNGTSLNENSTWQQNLTAVSYGSLSLGDIDNDGDLDLALSGCEGQAQYVDGCPGGSEIVTLIYINNGTTLTESSQWQSNLTGVYRPGSLTFADINNDGDLDLALTGQTDSTYISKIYINNGTSLVESSQWQSNLTGMRESSLAFGDFDNDNDLDLILSGIDISSNVRTYAYLNNGTTFIESSQWGNDCLTDVSDSSITFADFDNDGDLDLSLAGCCDEHRIYRNNGIAFVEINREVTGGLDGFFAGSVAFGDYDTDGYLDLITSGREDGTFLYLYNQSTNNFTDHSQDPESHIANIHYSSIAWIDLDDDTDLDLIELGYDTDVRAYIYISNRSLTKNNTQSNASISGFSSSYSDGVLNLSWGNGSDVETNTSGLYYNLMVGNSTTNHTLVSGVYGGSSNPTAGYFGNMMQRKNISLNKYLSADTYYWYVQTIDTGLRKSNWSAVQSIVIGADTSAPNISSVSSSITSSTATITWTTNETSNSSVYYGTTTATTSSSSSDDLVTSHSISLTGLSASTFYYYNVSSCDYWANCNTSSQYSFTTSAAPSNGNGGNGGGGSSSFWTNTYTISDEDFEKGIVRELSKKQRVKININDETHYAGIVSLTNTTATINITSNPIQVILGIEEEARVDILDDGFYDLLVRLNDIIDDKANLTIKSIHEEIPEGKGAVETSGGVVNGGEEEEEKAKSVWLWLVIGVVLIVGVIFVGIKFRFWKNGRSKNR